MAETAADRCKAPDLVRWQRVAPAPDTKWACAACDRRFLKAADDRSRTAEDDHRLIRMTHAVGGETWRARDQLYWFRVGPREEAGPCDLP